MSGDCSKYHAAYNPQRLRGRMAGAEQTAKCTNSFQYEPAKMSNCQLREMICRIGYRLEDCGACDDLCGYGREWLRRKEEKEDAQDEKTER